MLWNEFGEKINDKIYLSKGFRSTPSWKLKCLFCALPTDKLWKKFSENFDENNNLQTEKTQFADILL